MNERMKFSPSSNVVVPILGLREFVTWTPGPSHSEAPRETLVRSVVGVLCFFVVINKLKKKKNDQECVEGGMWRTGLAQMCFQGRARVAARGQCPAQIMPQSWPLGLAASGTGEAGRFLPPQHFQDHSS